MKVLDEGATFHTTKLPRGWGRSAPFRPVSKPLNYRISSRHSYICCFHVLFWLWVNRLTDVHCTFSLEWFNIPTTSINLEYLVWSLRWYSPVCPAIYRYTQWPRYVLATSLACGWRIRKHAYSNICEKDQQDTQFISFICFIDAILYMLRRNIYIIRRLLLYMQRIAFSMRVKRLRWSRGSRVQIRPKPSDF
jgi:hypothetical protein